MLVYSDSMPITDAYTVKLYKKLLELTGLFSQVYNMTHLTYINVPLPLCIIGSSTVSIL